MSDLPELFDALESFLLSGDVKPNFSKVFTFLNGEEAVFLAFFMRGISNGLSTIQDINDLLLSIYHGILQNMNERKGNSSSIHPIIRT